MDHREPARTGAGRSRATILGAVVAVSAALIGVIASLLGIPQDGPGLRLDTEPTVIAIDSGRSTTQVPVHGGMTAFDDENPAVANLDHALLAALRHAAAGAAGDEVELLVNSGWRSAAHQEQLVRAAIATYGSEEEAARWVATPEKSAHVSGDAVDVGPSDAAAWLSEHGAGYGLCQVYRNEPWHYELRPEALDDGCPPMYADPTQDPRMHE